MIHPLQVLDAAQADRGLRLPATWETNRVMQWSRA